MCASAHTCLCVRESERFKCLRREKSISRRKWRRRDTKCWWSHFFSGGWVSPAWAQRWRTAVMISWSGRGDSGWNGIQATGGRMEDRQTARERAGCLFIGEGAREGGGVPANLCYVRPRGTTRNTTHHDMRHDIARDHTHTHILHT